MQFGLLIGAVTLLMPLPPVAVPPPPTAIVTNVASAQDSESNFVSYDEWRIKHRGYVHQQEIFFLVIVAWFIVFGLFIKGGGGRGGRDCSSRSNPGSYSTGLGRWRGPPS